MQNEGFFLSNSFNDFLSNIYTEDFLRQLYMFSRSSNIDEAFEKIMGLNYVMFTEEFSNGLVGLSKRLELDLKFYYGKSNYDSVQISNEEKQRLHEMLEPEYQLIDHVKRHIFKSG